MHGWLPPARDQCVALTWPCRSCPCRLCRGAQRVRAAGSMPACPWSLSGSLLAQPRRVLACCALEHASAGQHASVSSQAAFDCKTCCSVVEAFVSVRRVAEFLRSPETAGPSAAQGAGAGQTAMTVAGSFAWGTGTSSSGISSGRKRSGSVGRPAAAAGAAVEEQAGPVLQNVQLEVPAGTLVALTGTVGSGKSSLLCAMLGEMLPWGGPPKESAAAAAPQAPGQRGAAEGAVSGCIAPGSSVAYAPQDPFILHGTLRWGGASSLIKQHMGIAAAAGCGCSPRRIPVTLPPARPQPPCRPAARLPAGTTFCLALPSAKCGTMRYCMPAPCSPTWPPCPPGT